MAAIETSLANAFETQLTANVTDSDLTFPVGSIGSLTSPTYLVIDPDNPTKREYIFFDGVFTSTDLVTTVLANRGLAGSASGAQGHTKGAKVRAVPMQQHFEDLHDRMDTAYTVGGVDVAVTDGGTGASSAPVARTNLGAAADAEVVHLAGAETISGAKTFSTDPTLADGSSALSLTEGNAAYPQKTDLAVNAADYADLDAAIAAAAAGSTVRFTGTHALTSALTIGKALILEGFGDATITQATAATAGIDITASGVTLRGFTLTGPGYNGLDMSANAVRAYGTAAAYLSDLRIEDLTITGWAGRGVDFKFVERWQVADCFIGEVTYAGIHGFSVQDGRITRNEINDVGDPTTGSGHATLAYGVALSREELDTLTDAPRSRNVLVDGNLVQNVSRWEGLDTHGGVAVTFTNNVILGCNTGIAVVSSDATGDVQTWAPEDCAVVGNVIDSLVTNGSSGQGISYAGAGATAGGAVAYATGTISGNVITGHGLESDVNGGAGIRCRTTDGLVVTGNTLRNCSPTGVLFYFDNRNFTCSGNTITDPWSTTLALAPAVYVREINNTGTVNGVVVHRGSYTASAVLTHGLRVENKAGVSIEMAGNRLNDATTPLWDVGALTVVTNRAKASFLNGAEIGSGGTKITSHLSATASLTFTSIAAGATQDQTITVTGAATSNNVHVNPAGTPGAGLVWTAFIGAANTVTVRIHNTTAGALTPTTRTWRASVWGY